jgi:hypothetical protein
VCRKEKELSTKRKPPAAAPSRATDFKQQEIRFRQEIRSGRPVARTLATETLQKLDEILKSGDRKLAYSTVTKILDCHELLTYHREAQNAR